MNELRLMSIDIDEVDVYEAIICSYLSLQVILFVN